MSWINSSIVTGDLFLGPEFLFHHKIVPSLQTVLNLNEIVELVVLKENLLMPTTDHIMILKNLNRKEIKQLGGNQAVNWEYEIKNLGNANLNKPIMTTSLYEAGILVLDTEQSQDKDFREFGDSLFSQQWSSDWLLKAVGLSITDTDTEALDLFEREYIRYFNNFLTSSSDPVYLKMLILAAPDLIPSHLKESKYDYSWMGRFYKEVEVYTRFAKKKSLGFSDTSFMQPFVALNSVNSESLIDIFYNKLKETRQTEIKQFLELQQAWVYLMPPLTSILLQRCRTLEDLPIELIRLRNEFADLRKSLTHYERNLVDADTIKEKIQLKREFQNSVDMFVGKVKKGRKRIIKTIIDFSVEQSDSVIRQDFSGPIKAILEKIAEYIYDRRLYPWVNSFLHLYDRSLEINTEINMYEKVLGKVNLDYIDEFNLFAQNSLKLLENPHTK